MYPWYDFKKTGKKFDLTYDDKIGIQTLYGRSVCCNKQSSTIRTRNIEATRKSQADFLEHWYQYIRIFYRVSYTSTGCPKKMCLGCVVAMEKL